jgi:hypothetical protein
MERKALPTVKFPGIANGFGKGMAKTNSEHCRVNHSQSWDNYPSEKGQLEKVGPSKNRTGGSRKGEESLA